MSRIRQLTYLAAALTLAACSQEKKSNSDVLAQDSSLTRDLQLANRDTAAQPQLNDVPVTPPPAPPTPKPVEHRVVQHPRPKPVSKPVVTAPAPAPTPPRPTVTATGNTITPTTTGVGNTEGRVGIVSAGTSLALAAGQQVCTNTNSVGDRFTATLSNAVTGSNGVVIPAGATAVVEITSLKPSSEAGDNMAMGLVVRSIRYNGKTYPVNGEITSAQTTQVRGNNNDAGKVLGGAAVGAILGRIFSGRSKTQGTIIGAAGGAAAGAVLAHQTEKYDACIPTGGQIMVRLDQPMSIQATESDNGSGAVESGNGKI